MNDMKICISRQNVVREYSLSLDRMEENDKFYVSIARNNVNQVEGFGFYMTRNELKMLNEKISAALQDTGEESREITWNPRSQRHETIKR